MTSNLANTQFLVGQLIILTLLIVGKIDSSENGLKWAAMVARYIIYLLTARGIQEAIALARTSMTTKRLPLPKLYADNKLHWMTYGAAVAVVMKSKLSLYGEDFPMLFFAFLVCQYLQTEQKPAPTINYGTGMACSFFEGYLRHVIPGDGTRNGFVEKIRNWESSQKGQRKECLLSVPTKSQPAALTIPLGLFMASCYFHDFLNVVLVGDGTVDGFAKRTGKWEDKQGVVFPVKRLMLVITKSLFCPPDLSVFNEKYLNRPDMPRIEPCIQKSLEAVKKDVAGVKDRRYSNTIYCVSWPDRSRRPVYVAAECATPLHTLHLVLQNHSLYRELVGVDSEMLKDDFVRQLQLILERDPATRGKCELVSFDDSAGSSEYLPSVLLDKIEKLEPEYREIIDTHHKQNEADFAIPPIIPQIKRSLGDGAARPAGNADDDGYGMTRPNVAGAEYRGLGEPDVGAGGAPPPRPAV